MFYTKIAICQKKRTSEPRQESITEDPEEEPFTEYSKRTLSLSTLKRTLSPRTLRSFGTLNNLRTEKTLFGFLVIVNDRVDNGDKFSYGNFELGRHRFYTAVT